MAEIHAHSQLTRKKSQGYRKALNLTRALRGVGWFMRSQTGKVKDDEGEEDRLEHQSGNNTCWEVRGGRCQDNQVEVYTNIDSFVIGPM